MANPLVILGLILMFAGYLWGLSIAFKKSAGTGLFSLFMGPVWVLIFLLITRPEGFGRPVAIIAVGLGLAILSNIP